MFGLDEVYKLFDESSKYKLIDGFCVILGKSFE